MTHPLIERLVDEYGYPVVCLANHEEFIATPGMNVLFFPGDTQTVRDATDVAVILPELVAAFDGRLRPGVVTDIFGDGLAMKREYGFTEYPALVFVRDGGYVGALSRVRDWRDYLDRISAMFAAPPSRPPGFSIPVVTA